MKFLQGKGSERTSGTRLGDLGGRSGLAAATTNVTAGKGHLIGRMEPVEAYEKRASLLVVDVREFYEFDAGHIEGAAHIPLRHLPASQEDIAKDRPVVVACQVGQRSALAAAFLRERGWDAHNLEGGMEAWAAAGLPFVSNEGTTGTVAEGWTQTLKDWQT